MNDYVWKVGDKFIDEGYPQGGIATIIEINGNRLAVIWAAHGGRTGGRDLPDPELRLVTPLDELL